MRNGVLIGIDAGTTVFKAAAFDARSGKVLALSQHPLAVISSKPGWRETPIAALNNALDVTMRELRVHVGARWKNVTAIGIAAQGGSTIVVDRTSRKPFTNMILWSDARGNECSRVERKRKTEAWWRARMLNNWMPAGLGRLKWLITNHPELCKSKNAMFIGAGEYLYHTFTGRWFQDRGSALQIGTYSPSTGKLGTGPIVSLIPSLRENQFAPLRKTNATHPLSLAASARFCLLNSNLIVAGPYMDQEAGLLSVSGVSTNPLQISLGTAWVGNFKISKHGLGFAGLQFVVRGADKDDRIVILPLLTGNSAWDWALAQFAGSRKKNTLQAADQIFRESLLPPDGMVCIPWLMQANPIDSAYQGAGTFFGVSADTTAADFLRAVSCGMCFELFRVFQTLKDARKIDSVILSGGAAKGAHFQNLIATLFAPLPVYVQRNEDTAAARGALVAFNATMTKSPVTRISALRGKAAVAIITAYDTYLNTYAACTGKHPLGVPYTFTKEKR
ncbi:MAG: FGGY family carbohydrate kinase [Candidatus Hydrogenedentes bacterium]|nr:FGGY family carbohydrate kinase [Candidatus Hydrogenedentota bacterium]